MLLTSCVVIICTNVIKNVFFSHNPRIFVTLKDKEKADLKVATLVFFGHTILASNKTGLYLMRIASYPRQNTC